MQFETELLGAEHPYACPIDRSPLALRGDGFACGRCGAAYRIEHSVAQLDVVRNPQAAVFDEQHQTARPLDDVTKSRNVALAERFLDTLGPGTVFEHKTVLEIACGSGSLTFGLAHSPRVRSSTIHAFDHSTASLASARSIVAAPPHGNRVFLSAQDVHALAFRERSFDIVVGNAVIHHFSDAGNVMGALARLLRPGGAAVFAEPFAYGYVIATTILLQSARLAGVDLREPGPGLGLAAFIAEDVSYRVAHAHAEGMLERLVDKHLFTTEYIAEVAVRHDLKWRTVTYERSEFYRKFMKRFLDEYQISHLEVRRIALELYETAWQHMSASFADVFPHFKFIVLEPQDSLLGA